MLEDKITLILITVAANLGLLVAGLIVMAIHQSRTIRVLKRIQTLEDRILARMLMEDRDREMTIQGTPATLEDLIQMDLMEQMGQVAPMTDRQVQEMVQEMKADPNLTPATTEDLVKVLETRATSLQTTAKAGTTGKVAKTETPDRPRTIVAGRTNK